MSKDSPKFVVVCSSALSITETMWREIDKNVDEFSANIPTFASKVHKKGRTLLKFLLKQCKREYLRDDEE